MALPTVRNLITRLTTRLMVVAVFVGNALVIVAWLTSQESYGRRLSIAVVWAPSVLVIWSLGTIALLSAGRSRLALLFFICLPLVGVLYSEALLQLSSAGSAGLAGVLLLLAVFDIALVLIVHQLVTGALSRSNRVPPQR